LVMCELFGEQAMTANKSAKVTTYNVVCFTWVG
jgi:hypothetical protein